MYPAFLHVQTASLQMAESSQSTCQKRKPDNNARRALCSSSPRQLTWRVAVAMASLRLRGDATDLLRPRDVQGTSVSRATGMLKPCARGVSSYLQVYGVMRSLLGKELCITGSTQAVDPQVAQHNAQTFVKTIAERLRLRE